MDPLEKQVYRWEGERNGYVFHGNMIGTHTSVAAALSKYESPGVRFLLVSHLANARTFEIRNSPDKFRELTP